MKIRSWTSTDESMAQLADVAEQRKEMYPRESIRYYGYSSIIRDAIDLLHRYEVDGESIIHEDDLRFS